jgi:hypothetical protein
VSVAGCAFLFRRIMKFITVTPIWYNSTTNIYQNQDSRITIAVDAIAYVTHPSTKMKDQYYTIWFKGLGHQDTIKTFDDVVFDLKRSNDYE